MKEEYGPFLLRVVLGLFFLMMGIGKLMNPNGIIGMLGSLGFPGPAFFGWVLIIAEMIFGLALIIGLWTRWSVWPLVIILLVAMFVVHIPAISFADPSTIANLFWHLLGIAVCISLYMTGGGALAIIKDD